MNEGAIFLWLLLLTITTVVQAIGTVYIVIRWMPVRDRLAALDYAEQLQRVLDMVTARMLHSDADLRRRVSTLLTALDNDPLAAEKHHVAIVTLRERMNS